MIINFHSDIFSAFLDIIAHLLMISSCFLCLIALIKIIKNEFSSCYQDKLSPESYTRIDPNIDQSCIPEYKDLLKYTDVLVSKRSAVNYVEYRKEYYSSILLSGPPGTGKSDFVAHLARQLNCDLITLGNSDIGSKYMHETAQKLNKAYDRALTCARNHPTKLVIFQIDEIDTFATQRNSDEQSFGARARDEEVNDFLQILDRQKRDNLSLDQNKGKVVFCFTTNNPTGLDSAFSRAGRIDLHLKFLPFDQKQRWEAVKNYITATLSISQSELDKFKPIIESAPAMTLADLGAISSNYKRALRFSESNQAKASIFEQALQTVVNSKRPTSASATNMMYI